MKRSAHTLRIRLSDSVAFHGYRWLAWAVAALALTLPGHAVDGIPRDAFLLLLLLVINVALTALSRSYVRLARRRPGLLALDLLFCAAVVWLGGGDLLPFLPYALGSLILPALLFNWRGALLASTTFAALDQLGTALIQGRPDDNVALTVLTARILAPFAFGFCWLAVGQVLPRAGSASLASGHSPAPPDDQSEPRDDAVTNQGALVRLADRNLLDRDPSSARSGAAPLALARTASAPQADPARRVMYDLTPGPQVGLPMALERLASSVGRQCGVSVRVALVGTTQRLTLAQHSVLLRVAQEALLNVQQHARARTAQLTLTFEPRAVTMVVQDDGVGLLDGTYERPGLHALRAVRYRLAELDGQLAVFESESGGVTVRATLPLE